MATAAPAKRKSVKRPSNKPSSAVKAKADDLAAELQRYQSVFGEIGRFVDTIRETETELQEANEILAQLKEQYEAAREKVRELESYKEGARLGLLRYVSRGDEILPLFDQMEPTDEEVHGANSTEWRSEPIAALRLSLPSQIALQDAEIMLVGQLQDRVMAQPDKWWEKVAGINVGIAAAIVDRLNDFIFERSKK